MITASKMIEQYALSLKLKPVSLREFLFASDTPCDVWGTSEGLFKLLLKKNSFLSPAILKNLINQGHAQVFIPYEQRFDLYSKQEDELRKLTRSLSIGNPLDNAKKQMNLLTINLKHLYENPTNDQVLNLQYQSVRSLGHFLYKNSDIHEPLYREIMKQKHHYVYAQPLLSSLFLIGVLRISRVYSDKEVESLFVTSYFKDIGMSAIPTAKYDQENLSTEDKHLLARHAAYSVQILQGRIPIGPNHLKLIENHHSFSLLTRDLGLVDISDKTLIKGFESMIISTMDIIAAMITERPYRAATPIFEALELVKVLVADQYPHEFRLIVSYFKSFFSR